MNEAPKKIWVDEIYVAGKSSLLLLREEQFGCQEYIRADLVDGLVKGLASGDYRQYCTCEECKKVTETLKALEEE